MSPNFLNLPSELRNRIYGLLLLQEEPIDPWVDYHMVLQKLTPGLFRANKTIHREASSLYYAQNCFYFSMHILEDMDWFLERIGRNNAQYIRRICLDFPSFLHLEPEDVTLEDNSIRILTKIQSHCANIATLTTTLYSTNAMELKLDALDSPNIVGEALKLVNTYFRAISSLQNIIVEVYEDGPSDHIRREMKSHGWTISAQECVEESAWSVGDSDGFEYRYESDGDDDNDDDYDIDNDSDFWRRAGD